MASAGLSTVPMPHGHKPGVELLATVDPWSICPWRKPKFYAGRSRCPFRLPKVPASGLWLRRSIRGERPVLPHSLLAEGHLGSVCLGDRVPLIHYRHAPDPGAWWPLALRPDSMPEQPLNVLECRPPTRQLDLLDLPARHADRPAHRVRNSGDHPSRVLHRQAEARSAPILVPDAQYDDALGPVPGDVESPGRRAVIAEPGFGDSRTWPGDGHESQCARDYAVLSRGGWTTTAKPRAAASGGLVPVREITVVLLHGSVAIVRLRAVAMAAIALTLAACTTSTVRPTGIVTGVAPVCEVRIPLAGEVLHVKVSLYSGSRPIASGTVREGAKYRFSVSPGADRVTGTVRGTIRQGFVGA